MNGITHVFFDLDHTLWDYETNARETLTEVFDNYGINAYYSSANAFINSFHYTNSKLWKRYNSGEIDRDFIRANRFRLLFENRGSISDTLNGTISDYFFQTCPRKTALIDGAIGVLDRLSEEYELGIITNGFEDTQNIKLRESGIRKYFEHVITSETAGHRKPSAAIFELAQSMSGATSDTAIMIGDNYNTDISGAKNANWRAFWFNPENSNTYDHDLQIQELSELLDHL